MPRWPVKKTPEPSDRLQRELDRGPVAAMTEPLALIYAKLLSVGCPPQRAVLYCCPELAETEAGRETAKKVAHQWSHDVAVIAALENINGGKWHELPADQRYKLALEKSNAEAAFFLWTMNFGDANNREELEKMKLARDIMKTELGQQPDDTDPMAAFARFALDYARNAGALKAASKSEAPHTGAPELDKLLAATGPTRKM